MILLYVLPVLIAAAFISVSHIHSSATALTSFAFAGLACSAFFPLLVGVTAARFPNDVSWIASMLTAAMMVGVGMGSYAIGALRHTFSITQLYQYSSACPLALLLLLIGVHLRRALLLPAPGPVSPGS
jgi:predicted MFS family arabinose efflux permease